MKHERAFTTGWIWTLLAVFLCCISSLLLLNGRLFNASIDKAVQETFISFMGDLSTTLDISQADENSKICTRMSQQVLENVHAKIDQALRISIVHKGVIWCDSDQTAIGSPKPAEWPSARPVDAGITLFETAIASGAVIALTTGPQPMELMVFVTPFKNNHDNQLAIWSLNWHTSLAIVGFLLLTTTVALGLLHRLNQVFDPELHQLHAIQSDHKKTNELPVSNHNLNYLALHALKQMDQRQAQIDSEIRVQ